MGWGMSSFLAEYLAFNLRFLSYQAIDVIRERRPLVQQLLPLDKNDILITFDLMMYSAEIIEAVEYIHEKNRDIKIITITNDPKAQIVQYSHLCFFIDILGQQFRLISLTAPFCFINAIIEQVFDKDARYQASMGAQKRLEQLFFLAPIPVRIHKHIALFALIIQPDSLFLHLKYAYGCLPFLSPSGMLK